MTGRVTGPDGEAVRDVILHVWHANSKGFYSHFDPTGEQTSFNNRRRIRLGADGRYNFYSKMPNGYSVPPDGAAERLMKMLGRHGNRPAHVHFFLEAPGYRALTTQINFGDDPFAADQRRFPYPAHRYARAWTLRRADGRLFDVDAGGGRRGGHGRRRDSAGACRRGVSGWDDRHALAADRPAMVDRLILICTSVTMDPAGWDARVSAVRQEGMAIIVPLAMSRFLSPSFISEHPRRAQAIEGTLAETPAAGYAVCAAAIQRHGPAPPPAVGDLARACRDGRAGHIDAAPAAWRHPAETSALRDGRPSGVGSSRTRRSARRARPGYRRLPAEPDDRRGLAVPYQRVVMWLSHRRSGRCYGPTARSPKLSTHFRRSALCQAVPNPQKTQ